MIGAILTVFVLIALLIYFCKMRGKTLSLSRKSLNKMKNGALNDSNLLPIVPFVQRSPERILPVKVYPEESREHSALLAGSIIGLVKIKHQSPPKTDEVRAYN